MSNAAELREAGIAAVSEPDCQQLMIDLSGVTFMDSSGIGALVVIRGVAKDLARTVQVSNPSERVRQVIVVCGLGAEFGLDAAHPVPTADGTTAL